MDVRALAARAIELFQKQPAREKRKLLDCVITRCSWKNGTLTPVWRAPFETVLRAEAA